VRSLQSVLQWLSASSEPESTNPRGSGWKRPTTTCRPNAFCVAVTLSGIVSDANSGMIRNSPCTGNYFPSSCHPQLSRGKSSSVLSFLLHNKIRQMFGNVFNYLCFYSFIAIDSDLAVKPFENLTYALFVDYVTEK
jgi:hypothetical protein